MLFGTIFFLFSYLRFTDDGEEEEKKHFRMAPNRCQFRKNAHTYAHLLTFP